MRYMTMASASTSVVTTLELPTYYTTTVSWYAAPPHEFRHITGANSSNSLLIMRRLLRLAGESLPVRFSL